MSQIPNEFSRFKVINAAAIYLQKEGQQVPAAVLKNYFLMQCENVDQATLSPEAVTYLDALRLDVPELGDSSVQETRSYVDDLFNDLNLYMQIDEVKPGMPLKFCICQAIYDMFEDDEAAKRVKMCMSLASQAKAKLGTMRNSNPPKKNAQQPQNVPVFKQSASQEPPVFSAPAPQEQPVFKQQVPQGPPVFTLPTNEPPVFTKESQQPPVFTQQPPVFTQQPPVFTQQPPVFTQQPPVFTQQPPVFTQQPPVFTNESEEPQAFSSPKQEPQQPPVFTNESEEPQAFSSPEQEPQQPPVFTNESDEPPVITNESQQPPVFTQQQPAFTNESEEPQAPSSPEQEQPVLTNESNEQKDNNDINDNSQEPLISPNPLCIGGDIPDISNITDESNYLQAGINLLDAEGYNIQINIPTVGDGLPHSTIKSYLDISLSLVSQGQMNQALFLLEEALHMWEKPKAQPSV